MPIGMPSEIAGGGATLNIVFIAWTCIVLGTGIIFYDTSPISISIAAPFSIVGITLLVYAVGWSEPRGLSNSEVFDWSPEPSKMPDAGRPMYRVDTTLEGPTRTSIMCGRCSYIKWVEGPKPLVYSCEGCEVELWEIEEE